MKIRSMPRAEKLSSRLVLALAAMAAMLAIQAIFAASPARAINEKPGNSAMTNGKVYASALSESGETLYIGGKFHRVKERQPDGDLIGRAVSNLAAIDVDTGAMIRSWRPQVTGEGAVVRSLAVRDSRVYIGGNFTSVEGRPRKNLAALGSNTSEVNVSAFSPHVGGDTSFVYALQATGSRLFAGGGFSKVNGEQRKNLAAFNLETGALDPVWKPETSVAPSCTDPDCSAKVRSLELGPTGASIFVGGAFSFIRGSDGQGDARQSVARVYTGAGNLTAWKIPNGTITAPQTAWDLTWAEGRLYAGFGATQNYLAAFNVKPGTGGQVWRYRTRGNVQSVELKPGNGRLFFGGHFGLNNIDQRVCGRDKYLRGLASLNPDTGRLNCDFAPSLDQDDRPSYEGGWTLTTTDSHLWVGGGFVGVSDSINPKPTPAPGDPEVRQTNLARFRY